MVKTAKARPATKPVRADLLCEDDDAVDADARKRAGVIERKKTVASTMVYAGLGLRASERAKLAAAKTPAVKRPVAKKPAAEKPAMKSDAVKPVAAKTAAAKKPPAKASASPDVPAPDKQRAVKRKRPKTHAQLMGRIVDAIGGQLDAIEAITHDPARGEAGRSEAERHARAVATLVRVLAELRKEQDGDQRRSVDDDQRARDAERPRDLDELRARLSRRLEEAHRRGAAVSVADDAAGGVRLSE
jgi:aminopeptidase N